MEPFSPGDRPASAQCSPPTASLTAVCVVFGSASPPAPVCTQILTQSSPVEA